MTRRKFLEVASAGAAWIAFSNVSGCGKIEHSAKKSRIMTSEAIPVGSWESTQIDQAPKGVRAFKSRPDLSPSTVDITTRAHHTAPGYVFVAPKEGNGQYGPMIVDNFGRMLWFQSVRNEGDYAMGFRVQRYRGEPVLTWAEGRVEDGRGIDEYVILDTFYNEITRFGAGNGLQGDHHEFLITPKNTALITVYNEVGLDLSSLGGPTNGSVYDGIIQELDIETGEVLFEWHSLDHVDIEDSYGKPSQDAPNPFDYFHINSIDMEPDGNLLVSSRRTFTVYKVDRKTGKIMWRLGGKKSDFEMGPGTRTAYQHDARRQKDGTITIFDNGGLPKVHDQSRGIVLKLDMKEMSVKLLREYTHPDKILSASQGDVQVLPNGNVFIGWGSEPVFSEFSRDGKLLFSADLPRADESYRTFRFEWSGRAVGRPDVAAERGSGDKVMVYASWNGATDIDTWQVLAGHDPDHLKPVGPRVPWDGFETAIPVRTAKSYIAVQAGSPKAGSRKKRKSTSRGAGGR